MSLNADGLGWTRTTFGNSGSANNPNEEGWFKEFSNVHHVAADKGAATVQSRYDTAVAAGADALYVFGDSADWSSTIYVESGTYFVMQENLDITVSDDGSNLDTVEWTDNSSTAEWKTVLTNRRDGSADSDVTIKGGNFDFSGSKDESFNWAGVWLHEVTDGTVEDVTVTDVVQNPANRDPERQYGVLLSNCSDSEAVGCAGHRCGYEGIAIRGENTNILVKECEAENNTQQDMQAAGDPLNDYGAPNDVSFEDCETAGTIAIHCKPGRGGEENEVKGCKAGRVNVIESSTETRIQNSRLGNVYLNTSASAGALSKTRISDCRFTNTFSGGSAVIISAGDGGSIDELDIIDCTSEQQRMLIVSSADATATLDNIRIRDSTLYGEESFVKNEGSTPIDNIDIRGCYARSGIKFWLGGAEGADRAVLRDCHGYSEFNPLQNCSTPLAIDNNGFSQTESSVPANPQEGDAYIDEGPNRSDGNIGERAYLDDAWRDL